MDTIHTANYELQVATKDIQGDADHRNLGATEAAKCDHANITMDHDYLQQEVTEHRNYLSAEDHIIIKGMEWREKWRKQMD